MPGFIYCVSDTNMCSAKVISEAGLDTVLAGVNIAQTAEGRGPGNRPCTLISGAGATTKDLKYSPSTQQWQQSLNGKYWIGWQADRMPGEADLARKEQTAGYRVVLNDQGRWVIPIARMFPEGTSLPQSLLMGADGKLIKKIIPKYAEFSRKSEALWERIYAGLNPRPDQEKIEQPDEASDWLLAAEALSINYHVGSDEINILNLFTTETLQRIYSAIVDIPGYMDMARANIKKNDSGETAEG